MHVTTEDELRGGLAIGRQSFNLGGNTLTLENVLAVVAGRTAEICNGTLRANGQVGEGYALQAHGGGRLVLTGVTMERTGVWCKGGEIILRNANVDKAPYSGLLSEWRNSHITMIGGSISGSLENGVHCLKGGQATLESVAISQCKKHGVFSKGKDADGTKSKATIIQGSITGIHTGGQVQVQIPPAGHGEGIAMTHLLSSLTPGSFYDGVCCESGGVADVRGANIAKSIRSGIYCNGSGSTATMYGGSIFNSALDGVTCMAGGFVELVGVAITRQQSGVTSYLRGSRVIVRAGSIMESRAHGVLCREGGVAEVRDVEIAGSVCSGVCSHGYSMNGHNSTVVVQGGSIRDSRSNGVLCFSSGRAHVLGVEIADCVGNGVFTHGRGSLAYVRRGSIRGPNMFNGVACEKGGQAFVEGVTVQNCTRYGLYCNGLSRLVESTFFQCYVSGCVRGRSNYFSY